MTSPYKLLVVDDEPSMSKFLNDFLSSQGYEVSVAKNGKDALKLITKKSFDLVLTDIRVDGTSGIEILKEAKKKDSETLVIMISAYSTTQAAVEAMNEGAYDFVPKPFNNQELKQTIAKALNLKSEARSKEPEPQKEDYQHFHRIIGKSAEMMTIYKQIEQVAPTKTNVLITGESGTGKELIARAIHDYSKRNKKPFVVVNCGGIPDTLMESEFFGHVKGAFTGAVSDKKGFFEVANSGTIFLDEIGELSTMLQVKLLRAVQGTSFTPVGGTREIKVDVRIISATNKDLENEVVEGNFREDLFFRLNVVPIKVPPLRNRKGDVEILSQYFAKKYADLMGKEITKLSSYAIDFLNKYSFPGNVRELENLIERSVAMSATNIILPQSLTISMHKRRRWVEGIPGKRFDLDQIEHGVDLEEILSTIESAYLKKAMEVVGGNKSKASKLLGLTLRSMRYRLGKYDETSGEKG